MRMAQTLNQLRRSNTVSARPSSGLSPRSGNQTCAACLYSASRGPGLPAPAVAACTIWRPTCARPEP
jgi:hypothetical protein